MAVSVLVRTDTEVKLGSRTPAPTAPRRGLDRGCAAAAAATPPPHGRYGSDALARGLS
jgi:hypothetical protein